MAASTPHEQVKRYDVHVKGECCQRGCDPYPDPFESADGIWVDYNDHVRIVEALADALATERRLRAQAEQDQAERITVLERAVGNCYMMARRQIAAHLNGKTTPAQDLERWQYVHRFCETTGSKSSILRGQLPTEITEGSDPLPAAPSVARPTSPETTPEPETP